MSGEGTWYVHNFNNVADHHYWHIVNLEQADAATTLAEAVPGWTLPGNLM